MSYASYNIYYSAAAAACKCLYIKLISWYYMSIYLPRTHVHVIYSCCRAYCRYTPSYKAPDDGDNKIEEKKIHPFIISRFTLGRRPRGHAAPFLRVPTQFTIILSTLSAAGCSGIIYSVLYRYMYMQIYV